MAEVEVDAGDFGGTVVDDPPHTHARAGMMWQGQKEVNHPSMGLGWHARIGASLGTKGPRAQESYNGSMGYNGGWQSMSVPYSMQVRCWLIHII